MILWSSKSPGPLTSLNHTLVFLSCINMVGCVTIEGLYMYCQSRKSRLGGEEKNKNHFNEIVKKKISGLSSHESSRRIERRNDVTDDNFGIELI